MENTNKREDDIALLRKAQEGDKRALETLYKQLFPFVTRYLSMRGLSDMDIEDLALEVFSKFFMNLHRLEISRVKNVHAYLLALARNTMVNMIHKHRHEMRKCIPSISEDVLVEAEEDSELVELLMHAIKSLPDKERMILLLRYYEDLSYKEVAEKLSISEDSVRKQLARTRQRLRQVIEKKDVHKEQ